MTPADAEIVEDEGTAAVQEKARPLTFDHLRSKKKPVTQRLALCTDSELADALERAQAAFDEIDQTIRSRETLSGVAATSDQLRAREDARAVLDQARDAAHESTIVFVFQSIGGHSFDLLLTEHGPTEQQKQENRDKGVPAPLFNRDSFVPALIAASCVDPAMSLDEWKQLMADDAWNASEIADLFNTAFNVNQTSRVIDMGKGSAATRS